MVCENFSHPLQNYKKFNNLTELGIDIICNTCYTIIKSEDFIRITSFEHNRKDVSFMCKKFDNLLNEKKLKELLETTRLNELIHKKDPIEEKKHTLLFILAIIGAVAAVAAIAYAVYRFVAPEYIDDFDDFDDFDDLDELDDDFEDEPVATAVETESQ